MIVSSAFITAGSHGGAYALWTFLFSEIGQRMLRKKGILIRKKDKHKSPENNSSEVEGMDPENVEEKNFPVPVSELAEKVNAAEREIQLVEGEDGNNQEKNSPMIQMQESEELQVPDTKKEPEIRFCRKCGFELLQGSKFCSRCGAEIIRV